MTGTTNNEPSTKPKKSPTVAPEKDWEFTSPYGVLKDSSGKFLERLELIHAFLMKRDKCTSMQAALRVFGPFVSDANSELGMQRGADKLRPFVMVVDISEGADSLFPSGKYAVRRNLDKLKELIPYIPHHHFDRDTDEALLYALGNIAADIWSPACGDIDLNDRPYAEFAEGYFPSVSTARHILG